MERGKTKTGTISQVLLSLLRWFDSYAGMEELRRSEERKVDWWRVSPFLFLHVMCAGVLWVGWSPTAVIVAAVLYLVRMFAVTGFYHRFFSHNAFSTSRPWQFLFAVLGSTAVQRGPLWWAGHHRHHHLYADKEQDIHSPVQSGFWWSHIGWITSTRNFPTNLSLVGDFAQYPELRFLDRFDILFPVLFAASIYAAGSALAYFAPELGTNGPQLLIWGFFISTVVLFHATATINSLDHMIGTKRYDTGDESRNNPVLALLTLGEGWHNNHHHYAVSARQGFFWWEIDITYYGLVFLSWLGIVRNLRLVPGEVLGENLLDRAIRDA
jgi:stearoyl-CoA desaturase (delta-9 desaturase)